MSSSFHPEGAGGGGTWRHTGARQQRLREGWGSGRGCDDRGGTSGGDLLPQPSCREGFSALLPEGDTQACPVSIYRFFKFGVTVSLRGPPVDQWLRHCPPGPGLIPGQDIKDSVRCNEHLAQPNK